MMPMTTRKMTFLAIQCTTVFLLTITLAPPSHSLFVRDNGPLSGENKRDVPFKRSVQKRYDGDQCKTDAARTEILNSCLADNMAGCIRQSTNCERTVRCTRTTEPSWTTLNMCKAACWAGRKTTWDISDFHSRGSDRMVFSMTIFGDDGGVLSSDDGGNGGADISLNDASVRAGSLLLSHPLSIKSFEVHTRMLTC